MEIWTHWWNALSRLRPAFSHKATFLWFALIVAGLCVRRDLLGVTSIVRALGLRPALYSNLLHTIHSTAIDLDQLTSLWTQTAIVLFPDPLTFNGRRVLVGDGIKIPKQGRRMPAVKLLHQTSDSNTKAEYIMGHSHQAISLLVNAGSSVFAVPLASRIHEGIVTSNRDKRTQYDKMIELLQTINTSVPYYFVADAFYGNQKIIEGLSNQGSHLVTRIKNNAVGYKLPLPSQRKKRGRPPKYGKRVPLASIRQQPGPFHKAQSPIYGDKKVIIKFRVRDLLWKPAGRVVRFVIVEYPKRGHCTLMSTDLTLSALQIIELYGLRFKIEHSFKQAMGVVGSYDYHFWMQDMKPLSRGQGDQYLHKQPKAYREHVHRKIKADHVFVQAGIIAQGLMQYLAVMEEHRVWSSFGSWLRTRRPGIAPSERVVAMALRNTLAEFLLGTGKTHALSKFITERQDADLIPEFRLAA